MAKFQPGQSGNPAGRPIGSKHRLSERFLEALHKDFEEHGVAVIAKVREEKPEQYLKVVASLVPKDINVAENPFDDISDEELRASIAMLQEELRAQGVTLSEDDNEQAKTH